MMQATYRCKAGLTIKLILHAAHGAVAHKVPYPTAPVALHTRFCSRRPQFELVRLSQKLKIRCREHAIDQEIVVSATERNGPRVA